MAMRLVFEVVEIKVFRERLSEQCKLFNTEVSSDDEGVEGEINGRDAMRVSTPLLATIGFDLGLL